MPSILKKVTRFLGHISGRTDKTKPHGKKRVDFGNPDSMLTSSEAAEFLNIHITTIRRWSNTGRLKAYCLGPRGDRRFRVRDLNDFLAKSKEPREREERSDRG